MRIKFNNNNNFTEVMTKREENDSKRERILDPESAGGPELNSVSQDEDSKEVDSAALADRARRQTKMLTELGVIL